MPEGNESLSYAVRWPVLGKTIGQLSTMMALLSAAPLITSVVFGEFQFSAGYVIVIAILLAMFLGSRLLPKFDTIQVNEALVIAALAFVLAPCLIVIPFSLSGIGILDALFEAISGITTTGLSTLQHLEDKPRTLLFARAWMDGFYRSGDAARFIESADPRKGLAFDGRIAEDFKLDTGTWVSAGPLRARIIAAGDPHVQDAVITGHDRAEVGALIIPRAGVPDTPETRRFFQGLIDMLALEASSSSTRIARAMLLTAPLSIDAGEITDKGSINQRAVLKARGALVEELYAAVPSPRVILPST